MSADKIQQQLLNVAELRERVVAKWRDYLVEGGIPESRHTNAAILLENQHGWRRSLQEATGTAQVGVYDKLLMPVIAAVAATFVSEEFVSVQPMHGRVGLIFFEDMRFGSNRGKVRKGMTANSALTGWNKDSGYNYSSENIDSEVIGAGDTTDVTPLGTAYILEAHDVRPGTFVATYKNSAAAQAILSDDGNGNIVSSTAGDLDTSDPTYNKIDYVTGTISNLTFDTGKAPLVQDIVASYSFNGEGTDQIAEFDLGLTSLSVEAERRRLRFHLNLEAGVDYEAYFGKSAEVTIASKMVQQMRTEIDRQNIAALFRTAVANDTSGRVPKVTFAETPDPGVSEFVNRQNFGFFLTRGANQVLKATNRAPANRLLCGVDVASYIQSFSGTLFQGAPQEDSTIGPRFIGTAMNSLRVYVDPFGDAKKMVFAYKGSDDTAAGYVYAPYIPFFMTPTITLDDFIIRKALFSSYATKLVNPNMYCLGELV